MILAAMLVFQGVFSYLLLRGAALGRDRTLEDMEQMEYLQCYEKWKDRGKTR